MQAVNIALSPVLSISLTKRESEIVTSYRQAIRRN